MIFYQRIFHFYHSTNYIIFKSYPYFCTKKKLISKKFVTPSNRRKRKFFQGTAARWQFVYVISDQIYQNVKYNGRIRFFEKRPRRERGEGENRYNRFLVVTEWKEGLVNNFDERQNWYRESAVRPCQQESWQWKVHSQIFEADCRISKISPLSAGCTSPDGMFNSLRAGGGRGKRIGTGVTIV